MIKSLKHFTEAEVEPEKSQSSMSITMNKQSESQSLVRFDEIEMASKAQNENKNYCRKVVMCSIHQPSSEVFEYFSHIILMYAGRIVFQGSTTEASTFFSRYYKQC